jgi:hypothetical protein
MAAVGPESSAAAQRRWRTHDGNHNNRHTASSKPSGLKAHKASKFIMATVNSALK